MNKEAFFIYLKNLRALETANWWIDREYDEKIGEYLHNDLYFSTVHYEKCIPSFCEIIRDILISAVLIMIMIIFLIISYYYLNFEEFYNGVNAEVRAATAPFMAALFILLAVVTLILAVKYFIKCLKGTVKNVKEIKRRISHNSQEKKRTKGFSKLQKQNKIKWDEEKKFLSEELIKVKELLNEAYNYDIVPKEYRFLEQIYYVYESMFVLNEEYTGEFITKQVEERIRKNSVMFENIMSQSYKEIIDDKVKESKNRELIAENLKILQECKDREKDKKKAEQYERIAENYTRTNEYFMHANHLHT